MADFYAIIAQKISLNNPKVKACTQSLASEDSVHAFTFTKKCNFEIWGLKIGAKIVIQRLDFT